MPYAHSEDGAVFYDIVSSLDPALVFVHGAGGDHEDWNHQKSFFSTRYTCVSMDLVGYGKSSGGGRAEYTIEMFAKDVKAVTDACRISKFVLVGHSMGGSIILEYWKRFGEGVVGLVFVDGGPGVTSGDSFRERMSMSDDELDASLRSSFASNFSDMASSQFREKLLERHFSVQRKIRLSCSRKLHEYWRIS